MIKFGYKVSDEASDPTMNTLVMRVDSCLSLWKNKFGYYWYDSVDKGRTSKYYYCERTALLDQEYITNRTYRI